MAVLEMILCIILLIMAVFLVVAVLMQHGKSYGLSGTISGGAETFFGKEKGGRIDKILARATTVIGIAFVAIVLVVFVMQRDFQYNNKYTAGFGTFSEYYSTPVTEAETGSDTSAETA